MEEITFDDLLLNLKFPEVTYSAVYDVDTGKVTAVGPDHAFTDKKNKISLDKETAELIIEGKINLGLCYIDLRENKLEIAEIQNIFKIDDVLHRIVEKKWSSIDRPDIYITYNKKKKTLKFELTEEFFGTKKLSKKYQPVTKRHVTWKGETEMNFLITDYNDPNILYQMVTMRVSELVGKSKIIENVDIENRFSIYTRRIFKNYIVEGL